MELNEEQMDALNRIEKGYNVFITGGAGTGKSTILHALHDKPGIVFAAPTAAAALLIGGITLHRLFALRPYDIIDPDNLPPIQNRKTEKLIRSIKILVIDEISMVRSDLFAAIDHRLRQYSDDSKKDMAFGGRQLVLCGDYLQLPPVVKNICINKRSLFEILHKTHRGIYAFSSPSWRQARIQVLYLCRSMRQKNDPEYKQILNIVRSFDMIALPEALKKLNARYRQDFPETAVHLCARCRDAQKINDFYYSQIDAEEHVFHAIITGDVKGDYPVEKTLRLKCGERVLITANLTDGIVNGTTGTIQSITDKEVRVLVDGPEPRISYPVNRYIYSSYTYESVHNEELKKDVIQATESGRFIQFPLLPAWAMTVHRAQGMTIDQVVLDIHSHCFLPGQCYVALSRCRSLQGLFLTAPLSAEDVLADPVLLSKEYAMRYSPAGFSAVMRDFLFTQYTDEQLEILSTWPYDAEKMLVQVIHQYWETIEDIPLDGKEPEKTEEMYLGNLYYLGCNFFLDRPVIDDVLVNYFNKLVLLYLDEKKTLESKTE